MFVLKRRDIRVAANCHIKVLTIFCCFAGPVYISVLFALGQDGEKFIHHECVWQNEIDRREVLVQFLLMLMFIYLCNLLGTQGIQECVHALED